MSESDLGDALVIVHSRLAPVLERNLAEAVAPAIWRSVTGASPWSTSKLRLCGLSGADWRQLLFEIGPDDRPLQQLFAVRSGPAIHFGMAPVSVALELGRRLGPTHRVLAYYAGMSAPEPSPSPSRRAASGRPIAQGR